MKLSQIDKYHLYRRACFFRHNSETHSSDNSEKVVDEIFKTQNVSPLILDIPDWSKALAKKVKSSKGADIRKQWREDVKTLNKLWLQQMLKKNYGLQEKMTLFWHGHFACDTHNNPYGSMVLNNIMRVHALGNFKSLLFAVSKSFPMINYLHLKQNKKGSPNEDFARELCELFTLGRDIDYTEKDVQEIARAFTGWRFDENGNHIIVKELHDNGSKTIFGQTGNFSGEDVLNLILKNKNTARFISKKIYRFFVREKINNNHIEELATAFYNSDYEISILLKTLFNSPWFYESKGEIILSPVEFLVLLGRMFNLKYADTNSVFRLEAYLGQLLFNPPNVAGWPGGRQWIDSSRLALRLRLGSLIINKGYIEDELSDELDAMISKKTKKKQPVKFSEVINWEDFYSKNKGADLYNLIITSQNEDLKKNYVSIGNSEIIQLISTPDFQLT